MKSSFPKITVFLTISCCLFSLFEKKALSKNENSDMINYHQHMNLARTYLNQNQLTEAENEYTHLLETWKDDKQINAEIECLLGDIYRKEGNYENAKQSYFAARKNRHFKEKAFLGLGQTFSALDQFDIAEIYYRLCLKEIKNKKHNENYGFVLLGLGEIAFAGEEIHFGKLCYKVALNHFVQLEHMNGIAYAKLGLARFYLLKNNFENAHIFLNEAQTIFQINSNKEGQARTSIELGNLAHTQNHIDNAHTHYWIASIIAKESSLSDIELTAKAAIRNLNQPKEIQKSSIKKEKFDDTSLLALGEISKAAKNYYDAETYYRRCLRKIKNKIYNTNYGFAFFGLSEVAFVEEEHHLHELYYTAAKNYFTKIKQINGIDFVKLSFDRLYFLNNIE